MNNVTSALMKLVIFLCLSVTLLHSVENDRITIQAGYSALLYQHIFSFQTSSAFEISASRMIYQNVSGQTGVRIGLDPVLPEIYLRTGVKHEIKRWLPEVGIEIGYSKRSRFKNEKLLLSEIQNTMDKDIHPMYLSFYANPCSFKISKSISIRACEIQIGSHFERMGRTVRIQANLFSLGVSL
jgi:hypothetical protein